MPYKRRSLSTFDDSFNEIVDYLSDISPSVALRFIGELRQQIEALSDMPYLYPVYQHDTRFHKMSMSDWKYVVFYTANDQTQEIVLFDILHMTRELSTHIKNKFK